MSYLDNKGLKHLISKLKTSLTPPPSDNLTTYSEEEHVVGTWVDGSPVYEKSYSITNSNNNVSNYITITFEEYASSTQVPQLLLANGSVLGLAQRVTADTSFKQWSSNFTVPSPDVSVAIYTPTYSYEKYALRMYLFPSFDSSQFSPYTNAKFNLTIRYLKT